MMKIKVCGITTTLQANALQQMDVHYIGFIFYPNSKRYVGANKIELQTSSKKIVAVFVNPTIQEIEVALKQLPQITTLQFHGNESAAFCKKYKSKFEIIKAFSISSTTNINTITATYNNVVDVFLFDTQTPTYGGSGLQFDWSIIANATINKPFFLSGGIGISDIDKIKNMQHSNFIGVDVNSKFELNAGIKDLELVKEFVLKLK